MHNPELKELLERLRVMKKEHVHELLERARETTPLPKNLLP